MWGAWEGYWRFRVGPGAYRVIYTIEDRIRRVLIIRIDHRSRVYHQSPPSR
jgi:mRNA-degrading endonuclease RelE of RelBE toxin-antitoxin system